MMRKKKIEEGKSIRKQKTKNKVKEVRKQKEEKTYM